MFKTRLAFAVLLLVASSQALALFDDDEARRQIEELRNEYHAGQKTVDQRLGKIEAALSDKSALVELSGMIEGLKQEVARMNGQFEVLVNRADNLEKRQRDLYTDLDTRLRRMEQSQSELQQNQAQIQEKLTAPDREAAQEKQAYEAALNQFKVGNYQSAIAGFQSFLSSYSNSQLAPSAQYWIGNAYYALRDYKGAIVAQQKVLSTWPDNPKSADAMLNIASSQQELGETKSARDTLRSLVSKFPQSAAAEQAKQRLGGGSARR